MEPVLTTIFGAVKFRSILLVIGCCPPLDTLSMRRGCLRGSFFRGIESRLCFSHHTLHREKHKGRLNHSSITDRNQLWKPSLVGCFQISMGSERSAGGFQSARLSRGQESPCPPSRVAPASAAEPRQGSQAYPLYLKTFTTSAAALGFRKV